MDYNNPFSIQQNNAVPSNPFWSGTIQGQTERQAQPFIQNMQQSQAMDLQKKAMETGEFTDPRSVAARMSGQTLQTAQNQSKERMVPVMEDAERQRISQEIRALPGMTDQKIAQAEEATRNAKSAPHREMLANLGQLYPVLEKASEQERPFLYLSAVERMKGLGIKVPPELAQYDERHLPDLAAIYHAQIYTPQQIGHERVANIQGNFGQQREETQQAGANYRAEVSADAHRYGADRQFERQQGQETPAKAVARLRRELSQKPNQPEKLDEYRAHLEDQWKDQTQRDPGLTILRIRSLTAEDEKSKKQAAKQYEEMRNQFFAEKGIYLDAPEDGTIKQAKDGQYYKYEAGFGRNWRDRKNWKPVK